MDLAELISERLKVLWSRASEAWRGSEHFAVLEIVRALDADAYYRRQDIVLDRSLQLRRDVRSGLSYAIKPFLHKLVSTSGGVPWYRSSRRTHLWAVSYLSECSTLAKIRRILSLEKYGLAHVEVLNERHIRVETSHGVPEAIFQLLAEVYRAQHEQAPFLSSLPRWLRKRMRSYVEYDPAYGIRYDNDATIVEYYKSAAKQYGLRFFEREALPQTASIGGRTFGEWVSACDSAAGRAICHTDFAAILEAKSKAADLRNAITVFAFKRDIADVWVQLGLINSRVGSTLAALTLDPEGLDAWDRDFEPPAPFYIPYSKDAVLLPSFGVLANPYYTLFRHLRKEFRYEWDRAVDGRESIFRADMAALFPPDRYIVLPAGVWLKRSDGTRITDIDAVVLDVKTGSLGLFQLKWQDPFGLSLSERRSRATNIRAAAEWVTRVSDWVDGRDCRETCRALGLPDHGNSHPPKLFVMSRYIARFTGDEHHDGRATWLGWPELVAFMRYRQPANPLADIGDAIDQLATEVKFERIERVFQLSGLTIELAIGA